MPDRSNLRCLIALNVVTALGKTGLAVVLLLGFGSGEYAVRRDLSFLYRLLFWLLPALIAASIVLVFVHIQSAYTIWAVLGLAIFGLYTVVDFNRLRRAGTDEAVPLAAGILLDVLNIFLLFLRIFGDRRGSVTAHRTRSHAPPATAAKSTSPVAPTSTVSQRGWRRNHSVHASTVRRTNLSSDFAQANSVAQIPKPAKMTSQPGPGAASKMMPMMITTSPLRAMATRQACAPPGRLYPRLQAFHAAPDPCQHAHGFVSVLRLGHSGRLGRLVVTRPVRGDDHYGPSASTPGS
jgi:hypothetical protein